MLVAASGVLAAGPAHADNAGTVWLCRPGQVGDPCGEGTGAPIDCFYVYPSSSLQPSINAEPTVEPTAAIAAGAQVAPFDGRCDIWAPTYRQRTIAGLAASTAEQAHAMDIAYDSVEAAWDDYMAHYNHGRGVVLIGHSQGSILLRTLIRNRIDGTPQQRQLVSAIIPGADVLVAVGETASGDFSSVPACTHDDQIGCVMAWSTFAGSPPPNTKFGIVPAAPDTLLTRGGLPYGPGYEVLCTNPADLASGADADLHSMINGQAVTGYRGHCTTDGARVLMIEGGGNGVPPATALPVIPNANWGLHAFDMNIVQQDLLHLVSTQTRVWLSREHVGGN
ncbi:DUF3089 domain-containing protein [Nocardia otitidiscaviarum]|uniref:DUF3089 domain-containing protein n=2 Tax=Nocardia otitidiscaviarum TaxID=1823 RepID=A0A516NW54_9NOCA|nr:DUF3089 domain-containing protein [Nocardia otitidiscaviarum]